MADIELRVPYLQRYLVLGLVGIGGYGYNADLRIEQRVKCGSECG